MLFLLLAAFGVIVYLLSRRKAPVATAPSRDTPAPVASRPRSAPPARSNRTAEPMGGLTVTITAGGSVKTIEAGRPKRKADAQWIPPGSSTTVAGFVIPGGMIYTGTYLESVCGYSIEPALITRDHVARTSPDLAGTGMSYWPSYSGISPNCRAGYLLWLSCGRCEPDAYIGYVFLFLYGLERRVFHDIASGAAPKDELPALIAEAERLVSLYAGNRSFRRYASSFLSVARAVAGVYPAPAWSTEAAEDGDVLRALSADIVAGRPLAPSAAMALAASNSRIDVRISPKCEPEYRRLFEIRYTHGFPNGFIVPPVPEARTPLTFTPASASFGGRRTITLTGPDPKKVAAATRKLTALFDGCVADLDAYARWIGRNDGSAPTIAATALLPEELANELASAEARRMFDWARDAIGNLPFSVRRADELLAIWPEAADGKLVKTESVLMTKLFEKAGIGVEPDVRFGGPHLNKTDFVVLFRLGDDFAQVATPEYLGATTLVRLAINVALADDHMSPEEEAALEAHLDQVLSLSRAESARLRAHVAWLRATRPSLAGMKKRVESMRAAQRQAIGQFLVALAGADGYVSPDELDVLKKVYPALGLDASAVFGDVHAMTASTAEDDEPPTVVEGSQTTGASIPPRPPGAGVRLDMKLVQRRVAESAQVAAVLGAVFQDEDTPAPVAPVQAPSTVAVGGRTPLASLLAELSAKPEWTRAEFESLAAAHGLMEDGAIERLNDLSFDALGTPLVDGDDPMLLDLTAAQELRV
jgi:tellurite resistance protein